MAPLAAACVTLRTRGYPLFLCGMANRRIRKKVRAMLNSGFDLLLFPVWLLIQRLRHGKKLVILCRPGALGDVLCTLPMCGEIRRRHPGTALVFITNTAYGKMVLLSGAADGVYGARSWQWPFTLPMSYRWSGIVEEIYNPQTTDERFPGAGAQSHLIDDLAESCGVTIPAAERQPRLSVSPELIKASQAAHGLADCVGGGRLVVGINCGRTWPVRMWDAAKWQALVDRIHAEFDAVVLQFGLTSGDEDEYEHLKGVRLLVNRLQSDELAGLIAGCDMVVSIDSGPIHIAGAVGVPVVGLFGAVNPRFRLPPDSPSVAKFSPVPCLFCHHKTPRGHWQTGCPYDIRCMKELEVETVFRAVKECRAEAVATS